MHHQQQSTPADQEEEKKLFPPTSEDDDDVQEVAVARPPPPPPPPPPPTSSVTKATKDVIVISDDDETDGTAPCKEAPPPVPPSAATDNKNSAPLQVAHQEPSTSSCIHYDPYFHKKRTAATMNGPSGGAARKFSFNILEEIVRHPNPQTDGIILRTEDFTLIHDAFPKASVHMLLLPNKNTDKYRKLRELDAADEATMLMLRKMQQFAMTVVIPAVKQNLLQRVENSSSSGPDSCTVPVKLLRDEHGSCWQAGFHVVPSLTHLHLHIMTKDFHNAPSLKNKKHYNSFATDFFIPIDVAMRRMEKANQEKRGTGSTAVGAALDEYTDYRALESQSMRCWKCDEQITTMPKMKAHLAVCTGF